jgi:hypothetical protein
MHRPCKKTLDASCALQYTLINKVTKGVAKMNYTTIKNIIANNFIIKASVIDIITNTIIREYDIEEVTNECIIELVEKKFCNIQD